jgi:hypothetical protein
LALRRSFFFFAGSRSSSARFFARRPRERAAEAFSSVERYLPIASVDKPGPNCAASGVSRRSKAPQPTRTIDARFIRCSS